MTERESAPTRAARSLPGGAYFHVRCLDCGRVFSLNTTSMLDDSAIRFRESLFDHTNETGHRVAVTITESFQIETLR